MRFAKAVKIVLVVVPLLLIAVGVGAIAVLKNTDFSQYKPQLEAQVKAATGRDLRIGGDLVVEISLSPAVTASQLSFANADWGTRPEMVTLDRVEAQIDVLPLLFGRLVIDRLILEGADILLEVNREGQANFDFGGNKPAPAKGSGKTLELPVGAREVAIRNSLVTYRNDLTGGSYKTQVDLLEIAAKSMDQPVHLSFEGSQNDVPISVKGSLGTASAMLSPDNPWPVDATIEGGGATIRIKGNIAKPVSVAGIDLDISISGDEMGGLSHLAGADIPQIGAYSLSGKLTGDVASELVFAGLNAEAAGSDLSGVVRVKLAGERPAVSGDLTSKNIDLSPLGGPVRAGEAPEKRDKVFPSDPLPLDAMRAVDADFELKAGNVVMGGARLQDATLGLSLKGGNLTFKPIRGGLADGALDGSMQLDGRKKAARLSANVTLDGADLGILMKDLGVAGDVEGRANTKLEVSGAGQSLAGIMAGMNGEISFVMGKGRMKSAALNTLIGGPTQVLGNILKGGDNEYTAINCAVVRFPVKNGVATAEPMVLDTDVATFAGKGTINLGTEKLDLRIDPDVKKTTISAAVPVEIGGTLANPEYSLEKLGVARKVGGLLGIVVFPPAAIVGLGELGVGAENPCMQQANGGAQQDSGKESGGSGNILKDAGEGITKGLKGLFGD